VALDYLNIAIIGCGRVGEKRMKLLPSGVVTLACDQNLARAQALASLDKSCMASDSVKTVLHSSDVDAVIIATENASLAPIAQQAVEAGKHVLVEKPGAIRVEELEKLDALAKRSNVMVRVGYNHRYHPAILKAQEIAQSGILGPVMLVRGRYGQGGRVGYDREWRANPRLSGGGELLDQGVHLIDLAGLFLGEFTVVEGHTATYFWNMSVDDNAFVSLRNATGHTAWLHASCTEWKNTFSFEIYFAHGKLHIEGLGGSYGIERLYHYQMRPEMGPPDTVIYEYPQPDESWRLEMQDFFADIRRKRIPVPGIKEARAVLAVVEKIYAKHDFPHESTGNRNEATNSI